MRRLIVLVLLVAGLGTFVTWRGASRRKDSVLPPDLSRAAAPPPLQPARASGVGMVDSPNVDHLTAAAVVAPAAGRAAPPSLHGTDVDGALILDGRGKLVVTRGARRFFDYFLAAAGEETGPELRHRIVTEIESRLPPEAARQAIALLDRYLSYREQVQALSQSGTENGDPAQQLARLHQLRQDRFAPDEIAALFGEDERDAELALARQRIARDPTLSAAERDTALEELEAQLPAEVRAARAAAIAPLRLSRDEAEQRRAGASAEDIHALRERAAGPDAAARLDALDAERWRWQRRIDDYRAARAAITGDTSLDAAERDRALATLQQERFTSPERLRVQALDRIEAQPRRGTP